MFQKNLKFKSADYFKQFSKEMTELFLDDTQLKDFAKQNESVIRAAYPNSRESLELTAMRFLGSKLPERQKTVVNYLISMLDEFAQVEHEIIKGEEDDVKVSVSDGAKAYNELIAQHWNTAVMRLNQLNGYQVPIKKETAKPETIVEVTEKTTSTFLESMHEFLASKDDYAPIQQGPAAGLLLHLGQLVSTGMMKMSNFERKAQMLNFTREYKSATLNTDKATKEFFTKLTDQDREILQLSDEEAKKKKKDLEDEAIKREQSAERSNEEIYKELSSHNEVIAKLKEKDLEDEKKIYDELAQIYKLEFSEEYEAEENRLRRLYSEKQKSAQLLYEDAVDTNKRITRSNEKIRTQIEQIKEKLKTDLDAIPTETKESYSEKKWAEFRESIKGKITKSRSNLEKERNELLYSIQSMGHAAADKNFVQQEINQLPKEHLDRINEMQQDIRAIWELEDQLYTIGERRRGTPILDEALKDKDYRSMEKACTAELEAMEAHRDALNAQQANEDKIADFTKKLSEEVLTGKQRKELTKQKAEAEKKREKLLKNAEKAGLEAQKKSDKRKEFGRKGEAVFALATFTRAEPRLAQEFIRECNEHRHLGAINCLDNVREYHEKLIAEEKKPYQEFYNKQRNAERFNRGRLSDEDMGKLKEKLENVNWQLEMLEAKDFKAQLAKDIENLPSKAETEQKRQSLQKKADEEITGLENNIQKLREAKPAPTDAQINAEIAKLMENVKQVQKNKLVEKAAPLIKAAKHANRAEICKKYRKTKEEESGKLRREARRIEDLRHRSEKLHADAAACWQKSENMRTQWNSIKDMPNSFLDGLNNRLMQLKEQINLGTKKGHSNSKEFKAMEDRIKEAQKYVADNKDTLKVMNPETLQELKKKLAAVDKAATFYTAEKQKGIHWTPSNMRFVRLQFAQELVRFTHDAASEIDKMVNVEKLQKDSTEAVVNSMTGKVKNPGKYKEFLLENLEKTKSVAAEKQTEKKLENPQVQNPQMQNHM